MSFLDSLLGTATSQGTQQGAQLGTQALMGGLQSGNNALKTYTNQANNALQTNTTAGLTSLDKGYDSAIGALGDYGAKAQGILKTGTDSGVATTLSGNANYAPFIASGGAANSMYGDALGLNGPAGSAAARTAFQTSPGYGFQVDQATDAAARKAAALGLAGSGGTLDAITRIGSNLANQEWGNWLSNLQGLGTQGLAAASDVSSNNRTAGGLQAAGGQTGAQLAQNTGSSIGNAYANRGTGEAGLYTGLGQGLSANLTGLGKGLSANDMQEALGVANLDLGAGQAQDSATNASNSAISGILGKVLGMPLGSSSLSTPSSGGLSFTPGAGGSFTVAPSAAAGGGNSVLSGLLGKIVKY